MRERGGVKIVFSSGEFADSGITMDGLQARSTATTAVDMQVVKTGGKGSSNNSKRQRQQRGRPSCSRHDYATFIGE